MPRWRSDLHRSPIVAAPSPCIFKTRLGIIGWGRALEAGIAQWQMRPSMESVRAPAHTHTYTGVCSALFLTGHTWMLSPHCKWHVVHAQFAGCPQQCGGTSWHALLNIFAYYIIKEVVCLSAWWCVHLCALMRAHVCVRVSVYPGRHVCPI